ncbi:DUF4245 domain-containing protein [Stackebrandtia albiflava]|nr:DUF4245 domain-containing protein [Stackebrandtia albiflava]
MSSTAAPAAPSRPRGDRRPRDMVISLAVLLVPIGAFFLLWGFLTSDQPVNGVDPRPAYTEAEGLGLDAPAPEGLPDGWDPLSAQTTQGDGAVTLRVGYQTPSGGGMQYVAGDGLAEEILVAELRDGPRPTGAVTLDGREWMSYLTVDGNPALVYTDESMTLVVHGDASMAELEAFAKALG